jgi:hypothetical protein
MRNRSVVEILVLSFTFLVIVSIMALAGAVVYIEIKDPSVDTRGITQGLFGLISATLGALLGLIAGKSTVTDQLNTRPQDHQPTELTDPEPDVWSNEPTQEHKR